MKHKIYVSNEFGGTYEYNFKKNTIALFAAPELSFTDIALHPDGTLYAITYSELYRISKNGKTVTKIADLPGGSFNALEIDIFGKATVGRNQTSEVFSIDLSSGALSNGKLVAATDGDIVMHKGKMFMAAFDLTAVAHSLIRIDEDDFTPLAAVPHDLLYLYGLTSNKFGMLAYSQSEVYAFDPSTGETTFLKAIPIPGFSAFGATSNGFGFDGAVKHGKAKPDTLSGTKKSDALLGYGGKDDLKGKAGADTLIGGAGKDKLAGGKGPDTLDGGKGADSFMFKAAKDSRPWAADKLRDFSRQQDDRIDLEAIDARPGRKGDQTFDFIGKKAFSEKAGELRWEKLGGSSYVYADIDGDGLADFGLELTNGASLRASDFVL